MKRYNIEGGLNETLDIEESENGFWVEWPDVEKLITLLEESRDLIEGVFLEYRAYRPLLNKIDKVLNNIEGMK